MRVNVAGLRFVADAIESNQDNYDQSEWGLGAMEPSAAGAGISCGTPACVAGFTVQFLGNSEEYATKKSTTSFSTDTLVDYAQELLGLPSEWANAIFRYGFWPLHWMFPPDDAIWYIYSPRTKAQYSSSILKPFYPKPSKEFCGDMPTAKQAASFLRRLADQFEAEQGENENVHKPVEVTVYE